MKREIADKWVAALRSGEYKQARETLACDARTKHCCLGVLCELAIEDGVEMDVAEIEAEIEMDEVESTARTYILFAGEAGGLPATVQHWADVKSRDAWVLKDAIDDSLLDRLPQEYQRGEKVSLAMLNDHGVEFGDIADIIDERWEEF